MGSWSVWIGITRWSPSLAFLPLRSWRLCVKRAFFTQSRKVRKEITKKKAKKSTLSGIFDEHFPRERTGARRRDRREIVWPMCDFKLTQYIAMRRIELTVTERERIVVVSRRFFCVVCQTESELLTVRQAAAFAQAAVGSVRRWLAENKAHGLKTCGGWHRVCKNSLFRKI